MDIREGYVYHIKDEYFEVVNDNTLMRNHESGKARPTYFCIRNEKTNILWFIPMSSKVEKYKKIRDNKIKKHGNCDTILIKKFLGKEAKVIKNIAKEIEGNFNKLMILINKGKRVIFTDVENDMKIMLEELKGEIHV